MDGPSVQLHQDLRGAISKALSSRRPLLTHLSADTAWLLSIPRPEQATRRGGRLYYNLIIDPWLSGTQVDVTRWLSKQWHVVEPRLPSIAAVEQMLHELEILASGLHLGRQVKDHAEETEEQDGLETFIDAVAISHEFTDHCHQQTLMDISPDVPVFATEKAASLIRSWSHFRHVQVIPHFSHNPDWHATAVPPLPEWLGISRLVTRSDMLYFHSALLITFNNGNLVRRGNTASVDVDDEAEAVIYTPHGIHSDSEDLEFLRKSASPPIKTLAFLHGLEDIVLGSAHAQLNLGAHNGLRAQRLLKAHYWIGTHDEDKQGSGIVGWLLRRKRLSVKDAVAEEQRRRKGRKQDDGIDADGEDVIGSFEGVNWRDVGNGESVLLV